MGACDHMKAIEARGLYYQIAAFSFLITLIMFDKTLSCTKSLSDQLQSTQIDLALAGDVVQATKSTLSEYRTDCMWEKIYSYAQSVSELHNIEVSLPSTTWRTRLPKWYDTGVVLETTGMKQPMSCSHDYKVSIYYPVLNAFLAEISRRFDDKNIDIMRGIQACKSPFSKLSLFLGFATTT